MIDPSFIFTAANLMQQRSLANNAALSARFELEESERQAAILQERRQIIDLISKQTTQYLHDASAYPKEILVLTRIRMFELETNGVIPDSFEDLGEKEKTALLWQKLGNILERCSRELTEEMKQACTRCLDAVSMQLFIRAIAERLDAYHAYLTQKPKYDKFNAMRKYSLLFVWIFPLLLIAGIYIIGNYFSQTLTKILGLPFGDFLILAGIMLELFTLGFYTIVKNTYYLKAKQILDSLALQAAVEQTQFWQDARENFKRIPTEEDLKKSWDEQEAIIVPFFEHMPPLETGDQEQDQPTDAGISE